jgi:hypothetical protein
MKRLGNRSVQFTTDNRFSICHPECCKSTPSTLHRTSIKSEITSSRLTNVGGGEITTWRQPTCARTEPQLLAVFFADAMNDAADDRANM